jgi:single-strand DNA-binding protein
MDLNKVQLIGRSSTEIELKQTPTGKNVVSFSLVTNKAWSDTNGEKQEKAEFHTVVAWGKLAEILSQYAGKGKKLYIE